MPKYIKSHSNYVLKSFHQSINDGTIYERNITTIGGVGNFPSSQVPIYRSNNFIITVRNDSGISNQYNTKEWDKNSTSGNIWTVSSLEGLVSSDENDNDTKIVLKQDYYDFCDFCYYGSLSEMLRSSITDIIDRFPGELYGTSNNVYYTETKTVDGSIIESRPILGSEDLKYIVNPFGINMHSRTKPDDVTNTLKYFANGGYSAYTIDNKEVTAWTSTYYYSEKVGKNEYIRYTATTDSTEVISESATTYYPCKGDKVADITLKTTSDTYEVSAWLGDDNIIYYLYEDKLLYYDIFVKTDNEEYHIPLELSGETIVCKIENEYYKVIHDYINESGETETADTTSLYQLLNSYVEFNDEKYFCERPYCFHITPDKPYLDSFYNECDNFQRLLLNPKTTPKYKAIFSVIKENENGYYREFEEFVFPTSEGGYNIDATSYGFNTYTSRLSDIGSFYDEYFTDNLYRSMTHEAIKNFDWTYTREYVEGDEEEYVIGGEKIQKALRIFAREFDETLAYINNIRNTNRITYDERGNLPDYFLTDAVENEGWNVSLVIPYDVSGSVTKPSGDGCSSLSRKFVQSSGTVTPYSKDKLEYPNGYFISCCSSGVTPCGYNGGNYTLSVASENEFTRTDSCGYNPIVRNRIRVFSDEREYSYNEVNNEFLRRLKLNSRYIWRHKGTIDGIDMILGMFGLRNKSFNDRLSGTCKYNPSNYDYEITEYIASSNSITDNWDDAHQMNKIDWVNSTKTITYDYRSLSNYNRDSIDVNYLPYQGLPVKYVQNSNKTRTLYPNFEKYEQYDGNPYFQMNGGWQDKAFKYNNKYYSFQFDVDDNIVYSTEGELFKETVRNIRRFDTLQDMLSVPSYELTNGQIVYVSYIQDNIAVLAGMVYSIKSDRFGRYIELIKSNGVVRAGDDYFFDEIVRVYDRNGNVSTVNINEIPNGQPINCYLKGNTIRCYDDYKSCSELFDVVVPNLANYTNYFTIGDFSQSNRLYNATYSSGGWRRLSIGEAKCKMINTIINDNNGNNPHNGMMVYDNGKEYFEYYKHLFKYALENDMFDERCYDNFENYTSTISGYGFTFNMANNDYGKLDYYHVNSKIANYTNGNKDVISNSIFNTKVIKITFKLHNNLFVNSGARKGQGDCEMKYIDNVVMNYLTQMIPSTAILQIRYTN